MEARSRRFFLEILVLLGAALLLMFLFRITDADIRVSDLFFDPENGWSFKGREPWESLYRFGALPGIFLGAGALLWALAGGFFGRSPLSRRFALFLVVALVVGQGMTVSLVKAVTNRPRPKQMIRYGGKGKYKHLGEGALGEKYHSFPSSHSAMGYFLLTPYFAMRRSRKKWAVFVLAVGVVYGTVMGVGRIGFGGHFASDILGSGLLTYLMGLLLSHFFRLDVPPGSSPNVAPRG